MAKYGVTSSPPTFALLDPVYVQQGVLADTFWGTGPLTLDTASWEGAGRPRANAIYNSRGQYVLNYPVLRVLAVGAGLLGWSPGDFAAMTYTQIPTFGSASPNPDLKGFFNIDPATLPTQPPLLGHPRVAWVVALKVVPVDDAGNPLPTGGGGTTPPTTPPTGGNPNTGTPLPPIITGNGGSSGGNYQPPMGYPPGYYPPTGPPVVVTAPPPTIDPNLLTVIAQQSSQQAQIQAQREAREAQYDFQYAQLQARQDEQDREERAQRRAERQAELDYRRQLRQLDLQRRQQQASRRYTDVPRGYGGADDDLT